MTPFPDADPPLAAGEPATPRYSGTAMLLHWVTPPLIAAQVALAWVFVAMPPHAAGRGDLFGLHKSLGLLIGALALVRIVWRLMHPAPPLPSDTPSWMRFAAWSDHVVLYAVLVAMPVSGYLLSASGAHGVRFFGLPLPSLPASPALKDAATAAHLTGQWVLYAALLLHLAGVVHHVAIRRDGSHRRMLPRPRA